MSESRVSTDLCPVDLVNAHGEVRRAVFSLAEDPGTEDCLLSLRVDETELTASAGDYFEALCQIRRQLEADGWLPRCFGSSRNVYPSGMCRGMGAGLKAYRLRLGQHAVMTDLVGIFDLDDNIVPVSVDEQRQFFDRWLERLGPI